MTSSIFIESRLDLLRIKRHTILPEFKFQPYWAIHNIVICPWVLKKPIIDLVRTITCLVLFSSDNHQTYRLLRQTLNLNLVQIFLVRLVYTFQSYAPLKTEDLSIRPKMLSDFKEENLRDQWINLDQISHVARLGYMTGCIMFWGRLYQNSDFYGNW